MFWEFYQQHHINQASFKASKAESRAATAENRLKLLEGRVEALALACQSMWELTSERTSITREELLAKMKEIDLRDGQADGRMTRGVQECPDCGRKSKGMRKSCVYCGHALPGDGHAFGV